MNNTQILHIFQKALREDVELRFDSEREATNFRMFLHRKKRRLEKTMPVESRDIDEVMVQKKLFGDVWYLVLTTAGRKWGNVLDGIIPPEVGYSREERSLRGQLPRTDAEFKAVLKVAEEIRTGRNAEDDLIGEMFGFATRGTEVLRDKPKEDEQNINETEETDYHLIYAKVCEGKELSKSEELVLKGGPPSEQR